MRFWIQEHLFHETGLWDYVFQPLEYKLQENEGIHGANEHIYTYALT